MTTPDIDDATGNYAMPSGGFVDYRPVTDPTTDQTSGNQNGAAGANQMIASCASMTHTSRRTWARFLGNAATPTIAVTNGHDAHWGSSSPVKPTLARTALGIYTVTWPATITDALTQVHTVNLRWSKACAEGSTLFLVQTTVAANVVTVYVFTTGFAATDAAGTTIFVEAG